MAVVRDVRARNHAFEPAERAASNYRCRGPGVEPSSGMSHWWRTYSSGVATVRAVGQLAHDIQGTLALTGSSSAVLYGNPKADPRFRRGFYFDENALRWALLKRFGLRVEMCEPEFCHRIEQAAPQTTIFSLEGRVVVFFPRQT